MAPETAQPTPTIDPADPSAAPSLNREADTPTVSRVWIIIGAIAVLLGLSMGIVMSSLGK